MKKTILAAALLSPAVVLADTDLSLQTVTATRLPEQVINDSQFITISRAAIELSNAHSLSELLSLEAGIQFTRNGGHLNTTNLYINGLDNKRILVLVNGERVGSGTSGAADLQLIAPSQVERIEIIRGARGALYGADAQAGVINIITRKDSNGSQVELSAGSDSSRGLSFRTNKTVGDTRVYAALQHDRSVGFDVKDDAETDNDGYERYGLSTGVSHRVDSHQNVKLDYQRNQGTSEYDGNSSSDNTTDFVNQALSAGYLYNDNGLSINASAGRAEDNNWSYKGSESRGSDSLFGTTKNTLNLIGSYELNEHHMLILGGDYLAVDVSESATDYDQKNDNTSGVLTGYRYHRDAFALELGARHDDNNRFGEFSSFNTVASVTAANGGVLSAGHATAYRTPTFNDLYYPGFGNDELVPERSRTWSASYVQPYSSGSVQLNAQRAIFNNQIAYDSSWVARNIGKSSVKAISLTWQQDWTSTLSSKISQDWTDAKNDETGDRLRRISPRSSKGVLYYCSEGFTAQAEALYFEGSPKTDGGERLPSYSLLNLSLNYQVTEAATVGVRVDNLSDREYQTISNYFAPGREWMANVRYDF
ncbi:TonB-dependent receptor domain-containing protein [Thalassolituus sp. LLYu03]|uniref:TonB-dependent receptor domain-containing protein n=1 Tax=Thalassolituus sp. LLYu03 TaxID=3421656 RepID=UPI003D26DEFB